MAQNSTAPTAWRSRRHARSTAKRRAEGVTASREDFRALELALAGRDLDAARRQAHRLKGAARTDGAQAIADLAEQIERDAARGVDDWPRYTVIVAQLDEAVTHIELPAARHRT